MTELKISLSKLKLDYLYECGEVGGTSAGFRTHVLGKFQQVPELFQQSIDELLCSAAIRECGRRSESRAADGRGPHA